MEGGGEGVEGGGEAGLYLEDSLQSFCTLQFQLQKEQ